MKRKKTMVFLFYVLSLLCFTFTSVPTLLASESKTTYDNDPPTFIPLGVYMSWERTSACARYYGIDRWDDVCRRLDVISAHNIDTLWVANMREEDLPHLIVECKKRNLKLLAAMNTIEAKIKSRWIDDGQYYDSVIPRIVKLADKNKTLIGWVLSDEPRTEDLPKIERLRKKFKEIDPNRLTLTVTTWSVTPQVPKQTKLPIVCVDLYPFFGPNDPNGPHTDNASKAFFRNNISRMIKSIGKRKIAGWVMSQCFVEVWGPWKYDDKYHVIGLPGSYLHWRCPTVAEIRWEIWETFRNGCKGALVFTITPPAPDPKRKNLPPPKNFPYKNILAKSPVDMGPAALLNPDTSPTPQLKELRKIYGTIAKYKPLIGRWKRTNLANVNITKPGKLQCFTDPLTGRNYAIIVNDDLHKAQKLKLTLPNGRIRLITLAPGAGDIIEFKKP